MKNAEKPFHRVAILFRSRASAAAGILALAGIACGNEAGLSDLDGNQDLELSTPALTTSVGEVLIDFEMDPTFISPWGSVGLGGPGNPSNSDFNSGVNKLKDVRWYLVLDGCASSMPGRAIASYQWEATPANLAFDDNSWLANNPPSSTTAVVQSSSCRSPRLAFSSLDNVLVKLTLVASDGVKVSAIKKLYPKDILVVSMGDSVASGEGNPDLRGNGSLTSMVRLTTNHINWKDWVCHRSALSAHVLAAQKLEAQDKHSVVTFFSTACSGASIDKGILGSQLKAELNLEAQVDQVLKATTRVWSRGTPSRRPIDVLLLSIGANDLGFGNIVKTLANPFAWGGVDAAAKVASLPAKYDRLADAFNARLGVSPGRVFISEYPDMLRGSDGLLCPRIVFTDAVGDEISRQPWYIRGPVGTAYQGILGPLTINGDIGKSEIKFAYDNVFVPLNTIVHDRSFRHGWTLVGGIAKSMSRNGYCTAVEGRMVRTYEESNTFQFNTDGTLHPNEAGHRAAADLIFNRVQQSLSGTVPPAVGFRANTGMLGVVENGQGTNTLLGMMPGTVPSSATLPNGVAVVAFQANTSSLYIKKGNVVTNTALGMLPGTSPSLTLLPNGQVAVAFQANTNQLWTWTEAAGARNLGYGMRPGTSPSIATNLNGNLSIAFQANTGMLWKWTEGLGGNNVGAGMKPDTSPSLGILPDGQLAIAFQGFTGSLATWINGTLTDIRLGMMPGTSPSLRILPGGQNPVGIAFQANTSSLWLYKTAGSSPPSSFNSGLGMNPKASPVLDVMGDGSTQIAMQANTNSLWLVTNTTPVDMGLGMAGL